MKRTSLASTREDYAEAVEPSTVPEGKSRRLRGFGALADAIAGIVSDPRMSDGEADRRLREALRLSLPSSCFVASGTAIGGVVDMTPRRRPGPFPDEVDA